MGEELKVGRPGLYPVSCANLGHLMVAQHCCLYLNVCFIEHVCSA